MRIKVSYRTPQSSHDFWHVVPYLDASYTVDRLKDDVKAAVALTGERQTLTVSMDGFQLLPSSQVQGLVRDGDTITITSTIQRSPTATERVNEAETPSNDAKLTKTQKRNRRRRILERNKVNLAGAPSQNMPESTPASDSSVENLPTTSAPAKAALPSATETEAPARKKRKSRGKKRLADEIEEDASQPESRSSKAPVDTQPAMMTHLLAENKNKKKQFMKEMQTREHVHFEGDDQAEAGDDEQESPNSSNDSAVMMDDDANDQWVDKANTLGAAFITHTNHGGKGRRLLPNDPPRRQYPAQLVEPLIYASEDTLPDTPNYDQYPLVAPDKPLNIGDLLAIKTLEMSESYTPEMSDWKRVTVVAVDGSTISLRSMDRATQARGNNGKFDLPTDENEAEDHDDFLVIDRNDIFDTRKIN
ncbi:hypothetical protein BC940DRAFT_344850 [Gongronella butleri]|nr:hypothetical protein BC940DRAFT_344850 [Gongronella butleri]